MKLFAPICGTAALMTAALNHYILSRFASVYQEMEMPLPELTQALLWKGGIVPTGLLVASAIVVFAGLSRKNNGVMVGGGIATLVLMIGAATLVPAALMLPVEKMIHEGGGSVTRPKSASTPAAIPTTPPALDDSIRN